MKKVLNKGATLALFVAIFYVAFGVSNQVWAAEGDVWLTPASSNVETNQGFDMEVHMDTGGKDLGAFNMYFDFDAAKMEINLEEGDVETDGNKGISKGASTAAYLMLLSADDVANGHLRFAGIVAGGGYANGNNVHIATIHVISTSAFISGTSDLAISVNELSDELGHTITTGTITPAMVTWITGDTHAPIRSNGGPTGVQSAGTTSVNIVLNTNENSTCKYDASAGTAYAAMSNTFSTTGAINHSSSVSGLTDGNTYTYYIRCEDATTNANTDDFIVTFDINSVPTNITLDNSNIDENQAVNTVVGGLSTTDADAGDNHSYSLTCTTSGADDASFNINGSNLRAGSSFDYESQSSYAICIRTDDSHGGTFDKNFTITVNDLDEQAPTLAEVTAVPTPGNDTTPDYTFSSDEVGTITYGGDCSSATTAAVNGNNAITFNALANGTHSNCTIIVTDAASNASSVLNVTSFEIVVPAITEVTAIPTYTNDTTPTYTFNAVNLAGSLGTADWGGSCDGYFAETVDSIGLGNNSATATSAMPEGTYADCTLVVNDGTMDTNTINIPSFTVDTSAPAVAEVTVVPTPGSDATPDYTFSSSEVGTITYGGDCSSATTAAISGNNPITFNALANGTHSNCTIIVTDGAGNASGVLNVTAFTIDAPTCTSFTYSSWSACQLNNTRSRTVLTSLPGGCAGGLPVISEACIYTPGTSFDGKISDPKVKVSGKKKKLKKNRRLYVKKRNFKLRGDALQLAGGRVELVCKGKKKITEDDIIDSDGKWGIKVKAKKTGGYNCKLRYYNSDGEKEKTFKFKMRIDTEDPEFTKFSDKVYKNRGGIIEWKAKDNRRLSRFKVYFNGRIYKTKIKARKGAEVNGSFQVPSTIAVGTYGMKVKVYDRAGNKAVKEMMVIAK